MIRENHDPGSLSIIIPTLNEEAYIGNTLKKCLQHAKNQVEIIVVDAGSTDRTIEEIKRFNVRYYQKPEFMYKKYLSLNFGLKESRGDVVLFLDADTTLPMHYDDWIFRAFKEKKCIAGGFSFQFDSEKWFYRFFGFANQQRTRLEKIFNGDQALFCKRETALSVGGYPKSNLMESALFCRLLKKSGCLCLIHQPILTSVRRFENHGFFNVLWFDIKMWIRFKLRLSVSDFGDAYWRRK
jgi:glycosyltransferase involved in cell wall biosynthesis